MTVDIRYPRVATVMLRKASRRHHPWQYRRSPGGPSVARGDRPYHDSWSGGDVYDDIDGPWGPYMSSNAVWGYHFGGD